MRKMLFAVMLLCLGLAGTVSANPVAITPDAYLDLGYNQGGLRAAISGSLAYVVGYNKFQVYDLSDPLAPTRLSSGSAGAGYDVVSFGRYAFTAAYDKLNIIDVTDPYAPVVVGTLSGVNGQETRMALSSHYLFITTGSALKVVDISTPTAPAQVGSLELTGLTRGIAISGQYALLTLNSGMTVVDISNPAAPSLATDVPLGSDITYGVAVQGNYAYVTSHGEWCDEIEGCYWTGGTLHVIDIANPLCPTVLSATGTPRAAEDIAVSGSFAYIIELSTDYYPGHYEFLEVNISDPAAPQAERYYMSPILNSTGQGVAVIGDYVFQPMTKGAFVFARQPGSFPTCNP
jgi:hypothetical protein